MSLPNYNSEVLLPIITVCLNSVTMAINDTLGSVRRQLHLRFEYIVIDGGSTDGTINLVSL